VRFTPPLPHSLLVTPRGGEGEPSLRGVRPISISMMPETYLPPLTVTWGVGVGVRAGRCGGLLYETAGKNPRGMWDAPSHRGLYYCAFFCISP